MMQWRRIDGVNEPETEILIGTLRLNKKPIMVAGFDLYCDVGRFIKDGNQAGVFVCNSIPTSDLKWFIEIEPPTGDAEK